MTNKRDRKRNSRTKNNFPGYFINDLDLISREKEKARKLHNSSWWKKKCRAGACSYCGNTIPAAELTMDHVIPLSRGGLSERYNIVPACKDCNNKKKYMLPAEWDEYLEKIVKKTNQDPKNEPF